MKVPRKNVAMLYLSEVEIEMLERLRDKFTSDWEKKTGQEISKSETVRRLIHFVSQGGTQG